MASDYSHSNSVRHFIGGREVDSVDGQSFQSTNPATGEALAEVALGSAKDVAKAVESAARAYDDGVWRHLAPVERGRRLRQVADLLRAEAEAIGRLECLDTGKPQLQAVAEVESAATMMEYAGTLTEQLRGVVYPDSPGYFVHSRREPYGVVGAIAPWNYPLVLAAWKSAPALAVGNSVVLKMAEQTPLSTSVYARLCHEAGIPDGVLNVVHGDGQTGAALVAHPMVPKITFTGSTETGRSILRSAAARVKSVHLELGGKSPNIVFAEADLEEALEGTLFTSFANSGQLCTSGSRLLVEDSIADDFLAELAARAKRINVGDPTDPTTTMGPLISERQRAVVEDYVRLGREAGATLVVGGSRPQGDRLSQGYFAMPTIFTDVDPGMRIAQEEIFGPVLSVTKFSTEDEAVQIANGTDYGLAATVWTTRLDRAMRMVDRLDAGIVWTNCPHRLAWQVPYEGHKQSGLGEDLGNEVVGTYSKLKVSYMKFGDAA